MTRYLIQNERWLHLSVLRRLRLIMKNRHLKLAILILLIGTCAFIMNVISPVTPTPTAQPAAKALVFTLLFLLTLTFVMGYLELSVQDIRLADDPPCLHSRPPKLLTLICILLI